MYKLQSDTEHSKLEGTRCAHRTCAHRSLLCRLLWFEMLRHIFYEPQHAPVTAPAFYLKRFMWRPLRLAFRSQPSVRQIRLCRKKLFRLMRIRKTSLRQCFVVAPPETHSTTPELISDGLANLLTRIFAKKPRYHGVITATDLYTCTSMTTRSDRSHCRTAARNFPRRCSKHLGCITMWARPVCFVSAMSPGPGPIYRGQAGQAMACHGEPW